MTLKEFEKVLNEDKELQQKLKKAKESVNAEEIKDEAVAMSGICSELGFDVPASEFALEEIICQELDDEELEAVAGGRGYHVVQNPGDSIRVANWGEGCCFDYQDTDCSNEDFCDGFYTFYPSRPLCVYDYHDDNCFAYDACDYLAVRYPK